MTLREALRHHLSLMHGWLPITVQILAGIALVAAICWGMRRWRALWLPWAAMCGVALTATAYWYVASQGLADNPAPDGLWIWIGLSGTAAGVLIGGWRGSTWRRRGIAASALPLCLLSA
ncbi:MAG TPA: esterase family protein, partial [Mycobacterium sp.]|nr:esterase family protein [Mycobacterium sp.]